MTTSYLQSEELTRLVGASVDGGLANPARRRLLLAGLSPALVAGHLHTFNLPRDQLISDLQSLAVLAPNPEDAPIPICVWLENAALVTQTQAVRGVIQDTLAAVRARAGVQIMVPSQALDRQFAARFHAWEGLFDALVERALAEGSCLSSGELSATMRLLAPTLEFGHLKHVGPRLRRRYQSGQLRYPSGPARRIVRRTTGWAAPKTPAGTEVFVYGPSEAAAAAHPFEVRIPDGGERCAFTMDGFQTMAALLYAHERALPP